MRLCYILVILLFKCSPDEQQQALMVLSELLLFENDTEVSLSVSLSLSLSLSLSVCSYSSIPICIMSLSTVFAMKGSDHSPVTVVAYFAVRASALGSEPN